MKTILVTGASSGIGYATAISLGKKNRLILCARNMQKLQELAGQVEQETHILVFDVRREEEVKKALQSLPEKWQNIDVLINNAGNAHGYDTFEKYQTEDIQNMVETNITGMMWVTKYTIPLLEKGKAPIIINLSSTAGKQSYENGVVYCASKAAVESFSKGIRLELVPKGIRVTNIAPGVVHTDFSMVRFKGDKAKADAVYEGYSPLMAEDIARVIQFCVDQPAHVQMADITIMPAAQADAKTIYRN